MEPSQLHSEAESLLYHLEAKGMTQYEAIAIMAIAISGLINATTEDPEHEADRVRELMRECLRTYRKEVVIQ